MMWGNWIFWILIGALALFMFSRGGCCGHAGRGGPRDEHGHAGHGNTGSDENDGETAPNRVRGGRH